MTKQQKLQLMKLRLQPVADHIRASQNVGDAFNLDALAQLMVQVESINGMTPQMAELMEYAKYIPVNNNINAVMGTSHTLARKQGVGEGKAYSGTGMDIPLAETLYDKVSLETKMGTVGYQYSIAEIATAMAMGITLEADKIAAARMAFERHMSRVAWNGEASTGLKGFYNQDGVAVTTRTIDFATASVKDVLDVFNTIIYDDADASEFDSDVAINTVILPTSVARTLAGRTVSSTNETPLIKYIRENNEAALEGRDINITANRRGNGVGESGSDRIASYNRDPNSIEMRIPQELQFLTAQPKGLDVFVPGSYIYQGVWLKRVDSMRYYDTAK